MTEQEQLEPAGAATDAPYWIDEAAKRIELEHPVAFVLDDTLWPEVNGRYRGLIEGTHRIALAPQQGDSWARVTTTCHELIHARQRELLGEERFSRESASELARVGNYVEGVHEAQAWRLGCELALQFYPPGYKVVHVPVVAFSRV